MLLKLKNEMFKQDINFIFPSVITICCKYSLFLSPHIDVTEFGLHLASTTSNYRKIIVGGENNAKSYNQ